MSDTNEKMNRSSPAPEPGRVAKAIADGKSFWRAPLTGAPTRVAWLRGTLVCACLAGLLLSPKLWVNTRIYPVLPLGGWFPVMPAPWDWCFFGALLLVLLGSFVAYRSAVVAFLIGAVWLALEDQNRCQPWFYFYWVMLLFSLWPERTALAGGRLIFCAVYFWAGVQKCNAMFFGEIVPFFLQPFAAWVPADVLPVAERILRTGPAVEMFIALALWVPSCRRAGLVAVWAVHLVSLFVLGPLGHKFNPVVWPWNAAMPVLAVILFPPVRLGAAWLALRRSVWGLAVVLLVWLLPALGFLGWCDTFVSFSLYTGDIARATILVSPAVRDRLPPPIQAHVKPLPLGQDSRGTSGPLHLDFRSWAQDELGVPPMTEPRSYRAIARYTARFAERPEDVRLVLVPRVGRRLSLRTDQF
jgi:hypothetical protein